MPPPPVHMHPGMHTSRYEGTPPVVDAPPSVHMCLGMHTPRYEGTPPVMDAPPPVHMCPGIHTPSYEGIFTRKFMGISSIHHVDVGFFPIVDAPPPVHMCPGMHTPSYEGTPPVVYSTPPVHTNAIKIENPTSQCALLGLKLVQLSTLAGRIFFCHGGKVWTEWGWTIYGV